MKLNPTAPSFDNAEQIIKSEHFDSLLLFQMLNNQHQTYPICPSKET